MLLHDRAIEYRKNKKQQTNQKNKNIEKPNYNLDSLSWRTDGVALFSATFSFSPFLLLEQQGII